LGSNSGGWDSGKEAFSSGKVRQFKAKKQPGKNEKMDGDSQ